MARSHSRSQPGHENVLHPFVLYKQVRGEPQRVLTCGQVDKKHFNAGDDMGGRTTCSWSSPVLSKPYSFPIPDIPCASSGALLLGLIGIRSFCTALAMWLPDIQWSEILLGPTDFQELIFRQHSFLLPGGLQKCEAILLLSYEFAIYATLPKVYQLSGEIATRQGQLRHSLDLRKAFFCSPPCLMLDNLQV